VAEPSSHAGVGAIPYGGAGCQVWGLGESDWVQSGIVQPDLSQAANGTAKWSFPLAALGVSQGDTIRFDVATSGSGVNDPGVDHLSRSDEATDGWDTPSVAGEFLEYALDGASGSSTIPDTIGDVFDFDNLDIRWVVIGHDSANLYITVNVNDNLATTDWTNFMFLLDTGQAGTADNPWERPLDLGKQTIDIFLGSWVNNAATGVGFRVWAPNADAVALVGDFNGWAVFSTMLASEGDGVWSRDVPEASPGDEYQFVIINDGVQYWRNDARARNLTNSVGNSIIHDPDSYLWSTAKYERPAWRDMVVYEMHVGTFSSGLMQAIPKLDYLVDLGINAVELMPIWEFAGNLSWGYNGSHPFAPESSYGTPNDLKRFVDECHQRGIAVLLDVMYNHWGPSDMDLWQYDGWSEGDLGGIYFYNDWRAWTPWGHTRPDYGREEVRTYIRDNVLYWLTDYRLDGFRIDGTKWIRATDDGGIEIPEGWTLLQWINDEVNAWDPSALVIAEDLAGNELITAGTEAGGAGFDSQWDLYWIHPIRGTLEAVNDSDRSMWTVRDSIMSSYNGDPFHRVIYTESHDEVANGRTRLPEAISPGDAGNWFARKRSTLGGALVMTSPGIPMIFQGQEFLEDGWFDDDDPLDWTKAETYSGILQLYGDLIDLRRNVYGNTAGLSGSSTNVHHINDVGKVLAYHRWDTGGAGDDVVIAMNFSTDPKQNYRIGLPAEGDWYLVFNSDATQYADDYDGMGENTVATPFPYDGMVFSGLIDLAAYSVQIFSQVPGPPPPCVGDVSGDGGVDVADILAVIAAWGTPDADITGDGMTDVSDLLLVIAEFGPCP
jgi:1,4-alpha-glucan branching enzyme